MRLARVTTLNGVRYHTGKTAAVQHAKALSRHGVAAIVHETETSGPLKGEVLKILNREGAWTLVKEFEAQTSEADPVGDEPRIIPEYNEADW